MHMSDILAFVAENKFTIWVSFKQRQNVSISSRQFFVNSLSKININYNNYIYCTNTILNAAYLSLVVRTVRAFSCNLTILNAFLLHFKSPPACSQTTMLPQLVAVRALGDWSWKMDWLYWPTLRLKSYKRENQENSTGMTLVFVTDGNANLIDRYVGPKP